jgi:hypothetical protein
MQLRRIIGYLQKLLYTVKRFKTSPTPTLNIYLFEGPMYTIRDQSAIFQLAILSSLAGARECIMYWSLKNQALSSLMV